MTISLPLRISLISMVFAAAVTLVLSALGGLFLYQQQYENAHLRARQASEELAVRTGRLVALEMRLEDLVDFDEQCAEVIHNDPLLRGAAILGLQGQVLYHSGPEPLGWPAGAELPDADASHAVNSAAGRLFASPILHPSGAVRGYTLVLINNAALITSTLGRIGWLLACGLLLFAVGLLIQQAIFWRSVGRPLAELVRTADSIQPDTLQELPTLPDGRNDDIGRLYLAFSRLMHRLLEARRELLAQNEQLEAAVRERTAELERVNGELALDIERRKQLEGELRLIANTDVLTGLANRAFILPCLTRRLEQARHGGTPPGLILFDFDGFKAINDRYGHAIGDRVLQLMARRLQQVCRQNDLLARFGGDEFLVSFDADNPHQAEALARRIIGQFEAPLHVEGLELKLGVSLGIALYPQHGRQLETLMAAADAAMYAIKASGGGLLFASPQDA
ncbi:diguanylate cyclase [Uliginosibacterium sp. 31-16]|uniref:diguanylate cyclase domain-containing protein n=1 Tax=Uliginosibacterium sp. 31-16 TaxID=3068315 RepID=UPI00273FAAFD|nr:diguanylate cyclase [Uliginosibacterium sp. 31-16]MDP5240421.1 diguanylate cyclase [Uliginosibacterium sp. 31-16]